MIKIIYDIIALISAFAIPIVPFLKGGEENDR